MKSIHATLLTHLGQQVTTTCLLAKVECVGAFAGTVYGFTSLDIDVAYNDGSGSVTYSSLNGFTPKRVERSSGAGVDNSEIDGVIQSAGITEELLRAGLFRSAKITVYRVNYNDLTSGRHEVVDYGRLGRTRYFELGWATEFRSLSDLLRQVIGQVYSITCRAQFGDTRCGKAFSWTNGTVSGLGAETDRQFTDTGLTTDDGFYDGGVIEWLTGDNAGNQMEIDTYTVAGGSPGTGTFALLLPMPFAISAGDTYRVRQDCDKTFETCRDVHANSTRFRGENLIPVDGTAMVPAAEIERS